MIGFHVVFQVVARGLLSESQVRVVGRGKGVVNMFHLHFEYA